MKKFLRIALLTALLTAVMAIVALADGWTQDASGRWQYLRNGSPVYNEWQKDSNGDYFYLGSDGYMCVSSFVDDGSKYVDSTGRMVRNTWQQVDGNWYYFEGTGRMVSGKKRLIDNLWYYFSDDGVMQTGWYTDGTDWYYADISSGGHLLTSCWKQLEPAEDSGAESSTDDYCTNWFYFQASGKAARASETDYKEFVIDGKRYAFDTYGRMRIGWVKLEDTTPVIAGYKFYHTDTSIGTYGAAHSGWLSAYVPEGVDSSEEVCWYYFNTKGVPEYGESVDSNGKKALKANLKRIAKNGTSYSYLFNENGNPTYGLQRVITDDGTETSMYLGTSSQCCLQKNVTSITESDGTWKYYFTSNGCGLTGVKNRYLYYKGKVQKALDDSYAYYTVNGETYLVNKTGYILYNHNSKKKADEVEYRSDATGHRDGGTASVSTLTEPEYTSDEN